jgi:hypothetical protein
MDIGLPTSSPCGVNFMPSSPPTNGVRPWPENLNEEFMDHFISKRNLMLLTPLKRLDYWYYLNNCDAKSEHPNCAQRHCKATDKWYALKYFELQDN